MSEKTAVAAPSAAEETTFEIPRSGTPEYANWRDKGVFPEKETPAVADSASADTSKETTSDDAADSAASTPQETRRKPEVEARFKKLTDEKNARIAQLERDLEKARRPKTTPAESSPAKPAQPQTYQEWRKAFKPTQWSQEYAKANPEASYEDGMAAMSDYLDEVRSQFRSAEQAQQAQFRELDAKTADAKSRYGEKFDPIKEATLKAIVPNQKIPMFIKTMLGGSEVLPDLIFVLGEKPEELAKFVAMAERNPGEAARYIARTEHLIREELSAKASPEGETGRNERGQFTAKEPTAPAKRGPESAPEPPIEIGNRGSGSMDESERALKAAMNGDTKAVGAWLRAENAKDARRRGA
jgi:hypothetical protein